ncbi:MAG: phosphatase PAP2 family protein [Dehalococcoidia bacterium]|nr:phosphatase PAP2 family protein [Dehalococcoidia bacterium]MDW8119750.1 phosphatase PAP2 family protein [Chloroflexota bacterium]
MVERLLALDAQLVLWLNGWVGRWPWVDRLAQYLASDYLVPVSLALLLLGMWFAPRDVASRERHQKAVFRSLLGACGSSLVVLILNQYFYRLRPFHVHEVRLLFYPPTDSSFPSNAAAVGFGLALGILWTNRPLGGLALVLASLWGLARVYAGVHYPLDVIGGAVVAVGVTGLVAWALHKAEPLPSLVLRAARFLHLA